MKKDIENYVVMTHPASRKDVLVAPQNVLKYKAMGYVKKGDKIPVKNYKKGKLKKMDHDYFGPVMVREKNVQKLERLGYALAKSPRKNKEAVEQDSKTIDQSDPEKHVEKEAEKQDK